MTMFAAIGRTSLGGRNSRSNSLTDVDGPAAGSIKEIMPVHVVTVRRMPSPPSPVQHLFEIVVLILDNKRDYNSRLGIPSWREVKKRLDENLVARMRSYEPKNLPRSHRDWICSTYFDPRNSGMTYLTKDRVRNAHSEVTPVFDWVASILRPTGVKAPPLATPALRDSKPTAPTRPRSLFSTSEDKPRSPRAMKNRDSANSSSINDVYAGLRKSSEKTRTPPPLPPLPSSLPDCTTLNSARVEIGQFRNLPSRNSVEDTQEVLLYALTGQNPGKNVKKKGPCDKCDGPHHADDCPHFKKPRDKHKDATINLGKTSEIKKQEALLNKTARGRKVQQPGDGSCLFHSLAYGIKNGSNASSIRAQVADFVASHPTAEVAGTPLQDWVKWDAGMSVDRYGSMMRSGSRWGGAIEMAVFAHMHNVRVEVWQPIGSGTFRCIAGFGDARTVINVCYSGGVHYDGLSLS